MRLPDGLACVADLAALADADMILSPCPPRRPKPSSPPTPRRCRRRRSSSAPRASARHGLRLQTEIAAAGAPGHPLAALTGPGFAGEIARGLPTALTLACADPETGRRLQRGLATRRLRLYLTDDVTGAELGGALKNVIAIACGMVEGAGLGASARAALMTRGFAEMTRLAVACGARPETLAGLSGLGDLSLTCNSPQSRNFAPRPRARRRRARPRRHRRGGCDRARRLPAWRGAGRGAADRRGRRRRARRRGHASRAPWRRCSPGRCARSRGGLAMNHWLFKSEAETWSWDDQVARGAAGQEWDGVRNFQARNHMKAMAVGDLGFFYHSGDSRRWSASSR